MPLIDNCLSGVLLWHFVHDNITPVGPLLLPRMHYYPECIITQNALLPRMQHTSVKLAESFIDP